MLGTMYSPIGDRPASARRVETRSPTAQTSGLTRKSRQRLGRMIGHGIIKLAHQSLIRTEYDRADRASRLFFCVPLILNGHRPYFAEAYT